MSVAVAMDYLHESANSIKRPERFIDVCHGMYFRMGFDDMRVGRKDGERCLIDNKPYNLGNPDYLCYPVGWCKLMIRSFSKYCHKIPRIKFGRYNPLLKIG